MNAIAGEITLDDAALAELQASFGGELVRPGDPAYEERRRIWNGSINRFPALLARCSGVADVIAAVRFARDTGLEAAVRGGGHSFPGHSVCDAGLVMPQKSTYFYPKIASGLVLNPLDPAEPVDTV